jgi:predicted lipoprotein with Yx(FWY)xxD motif
MRLLVCAMLVAAVSADAASAGVPVVKRAQSSALGGTILVTQKGRTLYRLSVEKKGRFICTGSSCLALWKPLLVPAGSKPAGVPALGTVKRPDGHVQVTYKGSPLYTFARDKKPGDARGDGSKDVGVWHPVFLSRTGDTGTPPPSGGGYGGGYGP